MKSMKKTTIDTFEQFSERVDKKYLEELADLIMAKLLNYTLGQIR